MENHKTHRKVDHGAQFSTERNIAEIVLPSLEKTEREAGNDPSKPVHWQSPFRSLMHQNEESRKKKKAKLTMDNRSNVRNISIDIMDQTPEPTDKLAFAKISKAQH